MFYINSLPCLPNIDFFSSLQPASGLQCICRKNSVQFDQDNDFMSWNSSFRIKNSQEFLLKVILFTRCLMVSTDQVDPSCIYFRISWILMERCWFHFFRPLHLVQGLRNIEHWLLQKRSMKIFDQNFRFLIDIGVLVP